MAAQPSAPDPLAGYPISPGLRGLVRSWAQYQRILRYAVNRIDEAPFSLLTARTVQALVRVWAREGPGAAGIAPLVQALVPSRPCGTCRRPYLVLQNGGPCSRYCCDACRRLATLQPAAPGACCPCGRLLRPGQARYCSRACNSEAGGVALRAMNAARRRARA